MDRPMIEPRNPYSTAKYCLSVNLSVQNEKLPISSLLLYYYYPAF